MFYTLLFLNVFWLFILLITGLYQLFLCVQMIFFYQDHINKLNRLELSLWFFRVRVSGPRWPPPNHHPPGSPPPPPRTLEDRHQIPYTVYQRRSFRFTVSSSDVIFLVSSVKNIETRARYHIFSELPLLSLVCIFQNTEHRACLIEYITFCTSWFRVCTIFKW